MGFSTSGLNKAAEDFFLRQEFQLDYQPVLSLDHPQIGGFEALLHLRKSRAQHYPANFIPLIEETSLRAPLARWILREACQQVQRWQRRDGSTPISVSVNLSQRQLRQGNILIHQLENALAETGLQPESLQLEIPEVATRQVHNLVDTLSGLKSLGIQLYLDNFMPSQQSLETLPHLPVDAVKMSHTALKNLDNIVDKLESTLNFADDLGVQVIAKRIETPLQLATLRSCGFRFGQGFLFAKPVTSREATALVAASSSPLEFNLATHVATMNKLSQFLRRFLGLIVVKYWRQTRPNKSWLATLTPLSTGEILLADHTDPVVDLLQQQDLRLWVQDFVNHCRKILPQLHHMLAQSDLTVSEQAILGLEY